MKMKSLDLKKKLVLNKEKLAQLSSDSQANIWAGGGSLVVSCLTGDVCIRPTYEYKTCLCPTWAPGSCYPNTYCIG
ncbi:class I lanthipeptide [Taibaiella koreensis]|uniref:class I lanthipeptide n=1 Tax=Taibaiella koreensis TaxID=1268548 RepID=UPI000E5A0484|nr:class I lanthipeptide [Taibaiella koreensis]